MPSIGLAHVATASFLASRAAPTGGFAIALAGGVAIARAAQRLGLRTGVGASTAAMLQTIALMGPTRVSVPLTQAITAPLLGRMEARGHGTLPQVLVTIAIRASQNLAWTLFYVAVIVGLDAYTGSYEQLLGWIPLLPNDQTGALVSAAIVLVGWAIGASIVQVLVYRRGLRRWPGPEGEVDAGGPARDDDDAEPAPVRRPRPEGARFDPRAVVLAAAVAFAILLTGTWWPLLLAVGAWLAIAWAFARGDRSVVRPGLILTAVLAAGTLGAGLVGGMGLELTLRRTLRAALLVLVATWLRYAAGEEGLREVFRRGLRRLERLPAARETSHVLDGLGSTTALAASGRRLIARMKGVPAEPLPLTDAVLDWVAGEAGRHAPPEPATVPALRARRRDAALVMFAAACALALPFAT
jgi:hypothetical protein